ncbi:hypothetical protein BRADI_5g15810v3 [Brachypodium distachyon]|uniref:Uncharacterized protein n=2 Tax=Brachypodium distachyon TaxID=15368 RepID=A0A0Q3IBX4_BRADI|nr:hypothetical protein BRADI_5g15810v3 [Brachypodium distachyon]
MKGGRSNSNANRRLLRSFLSACRKLQLLGAGGDWARLGSGDEDQAKGGIPWDVPRGHTVVYVGEELRRHVVRVSSLGHPLFRELLDRAGEEYEFAGANRLCLPCDEDFFLGVLCHVGDSKQVHHWRLSLCI